MLPLKKSLSNLHHTRFDWYRLGVDSAFPLSGHQFRAKGRMHKRTSTIIFLHTVWQLSSKPPKSYKVVDVCGGCFAVLDFPTSSLVGYIGFFDLRKYSAWFFVLNKCQRSRWRCWLISSSWFVAPAWANQVFHPSVVRKFVLLRRANTDLSKIFPPQTTVFTKYALSFLQHTS